MPLGWAHDAAQLLQLALAGLRLHGVEEDHQEPENGLRLAGPRGPLDQREALAPQGCRDRVALGCVKVLFEARLD